MVKKNSDYVVFKELVFVKDLIEDVLHKSQIFPTFDDFSAAAFSLAQLHGAYQLNISQLSRGYVQISQESRHVGFASIRGLNGETYTDK